MADKNIANENDHPESGDNMFERERSSGIPAEKDLKENENDHPESGDNIYERERTSGSGN
jgi:hypothetical protein